ncbi:MAG: putative transposase [Sphingomonas bacterium]|nr:putative transposase [Sphingomonas bacterium]
MSNSGKNIGVCKLTGETGRFVKSHLLPKALTRPIEKGAAFAQVGAQKRPSRRFDSWYDDRLVTQTGEDILTALDTFAIAELRRLKLIWQSWGPMVGLCTPETDFFAGTPNGLRRVVFTDSNKMRLFFLSLLWRAAASTRPEFSNISLRASDYRRLRRCIRENRQPEDWTFFPITLTQISTRGLQHNHSPMEQVKLPVTIDKHTSGHHRIIRFFIDGLIAHIHHPIDSARVDDLWPMMVGPPEGTTLSLVTWEGSTQVLTLADSVIEAENLYPGSIRRAGGGTSATWALALNALRRA